MAELTQKYFDEQFEKLASSVKKGFDNTSTKQDFKELDQKIDNLESKVDKIDEGLQTVETKLDRALYTELTHIEARVKRLEQKVGIKPA